MQKTEALAERILALSKLTWIDESKNTADLSETEFLTLDRLSEVDTDTVGDLQRHVGVLPAQMSRIIRHLESAGYIACQMNRQDKRKVDVVTTDAGRRVYAKYRQAKLAPIVTALQRLTPAQRDEFMALIDQMSGRQE